MRVKHMPKFMEYLSWRIVSRGEEHTLAKLERIPARATPEWFEENANGIESLKEWRRNRFSYIPATEDFALLDVFIEEWIDFARMGFHWECENKFVQLYKLMFNDFTPAIIEPLVAGLVERLELFGTDPNIKYPAWVRLSGSIAEIKKERVPSYGKMESLFYHIFYSCREAMVRKKFMYPEEFSESFQKEVLQTAFPKVRFEYLVNEKIFPKAK